MQLIEHVTVGAGGAASITFSAIPDTFTDLYVVLSGRSTRAVTDDTVTLAFNASGSGYSYRRLYAVPSVGSSSGTTALAGLIPASTLTANTFGVWSAYIPNYRAATAKSYSIEQVSENNGSTFFADLIAASWSVTDPITSVTLDCVSGNFVQYSSASLYGILAGSDGIVSVS